MWERYATPLRNNLIRKTESVADVYSQYGPLRDDQWTSTFLKHQRASDLQSIFDNTPPLSLESLFQRLYR